MVYYRSFAHTFEYLSIHELMQNERQGTKAQAVKASIQSKAHSNSTRHQSCNLRDCRINSRTLINFNPKWLKAQDSAGCVRLSAVCPFLLSKKKMNRTRTDQDSSNRPLFGLGFYIEKFALSRICDTMRTELNINRYYKKFEESNMEIEKARSLQVGKYDEESPFLERKWISVDSLLEHLTDILDYDDKFHCVHDFNEDKIVELMKLLSSNSRGS